MTDGDELSIDLGYQRRRRLDNDFYLVVEYSHEEGGNVYRRIIRLTSTQDKSEEEILNAIRWFTKAYAQ